MIASHLAFAVAMAMPVAAETTPVPSAQQTTARPALEIAPGPTVTLGEALSMADSRNLSLQAARAEVEQVEADLRYAWALLHPRASASLGWTHNDHAETTDFGGQEVVVGPQDRVQGNLQVSMRVLDARAWFGIGAARAGVDAAQWGAEATRQALFLNVARAHFAALSARSLIDIQQEQIRAIERHRSVASLRHRSGTGQRLDVLRAQGDLVRAREDLLRAHTALASARDLLGRLIGSDELPMPMPEKDIPPPEAAGSTLTDLAVRSREDLKLLQSRVRLADERLTTTKMSFLPSIDFVWQLNQQVSDPGAFASPDKQRWFAGLTLSVPLYDYTRYADLDRDRAGHRRAVLEEQDANAQAALEVRGAERSWKEATTLADSARQSAELAQETLRLVESAYANGTGTSLEVSDARRTSRQALTNLAARELDVQLALLELLRTVGTDMRTLSS